MHIFIYLALDYPGNLIMTMVKIDERLRVKSMSFKFSLRKQNNIPVEILGFLLECLCIINGMSFSTLMKW